MKLVVSIEGICNFSQRILKRMKRYFLLAMMIFIASFSFAQKIKFDTTVKIGPIGYKINCSNKSADKNSMSISLIGFDEHPGDINLDIKGRITKAEIDDLNRDGLPDLIIYIFTADKKGSVFAIACQEKKTVVPIIFPDIMDDEKLKVGYNGNDEFKLMNGILMRRFPVMNTTDSTKASTITRQILYKVVAGEGGSFKFKVDRNVDVAKP